MTLLKSMTLLKLVNEPIKTYKVLKVSYKVSYFLNFIRLITTYNQHL